MGQIDKLLQGLQKQTKLDFSKLVQVSGLVLTTNLKDAKQVKSLIRKSSRILGIPVTKEKEKYLVKTITSNNIPKDAGTLIRMLKGK